MDKFADICKECESELLEENKQIKAENRTMMLQKGVACLKHDLIHNLKCGACYDDMEVKIKQLREALIQTCQENDLAAFHVL